MLVGRTATSSSSTLLLKTQKAGCPSAWARAERIALSSS